MMGYGMMNWMMGNMFYFGFLGITIEVLIIIVLVLLIVYLWQRVQKRK